MKKIFLFIIMIITISLKAQVFTDIIVKKDNDTIRCEITMINEYNFFYKVQRKNNIKFENINYNEISYYQLNSLNTEILTENRIPPTINNSTFDSIYNKKKIEIEDKIINLPINKTFTFRDSINFELSYLRKNLSKRHNQFITGVTFGIIGIGVSSIAGFVKSPQYPLIFGGTLSLISTVIIIDSDKWFKRASKKPKDYKF